jgi:predicted PurR-regulated permease PerM
MSEQARPSGERLVPSWLTFSAAIGWRVLVTLVLGLALVALAILLSTATAAVLIALVIAAAFAPAIRRLRERGWNRTKAAALVSAIALGGLALTILILAVAFVPHVADLVDAIEQGQAALQDWLTSSGTSPEAAALANRVIDDLRTGIGSLIAELVAPVAAFTTALILGGFLTFFFLQDGDRAWDWLVDPIRGWRADAVTDSGWTALDRVGGYLRGTAVLAAVHAIAEFAFLVLLGVPLAGPLGVLVFIGGFVPYLGGLVTTGILLLVTLATNGTQATLILAVLIGIMSVIQGKVLAPAIYGRSLRVHAALVLVALPAGAALFGVFGLFAALPVLAFALAVAPAIVFALNPEPDPEPAGPGEVPIWLDRLAQWSWRALVVIGLVAAGTALAVRMPVVIVPLVLGIVLAATLGPATVALRRRGWSRGRAAIATTAGTVVVITAFVAAALLMMVGPLQEILETAGTGASGDVAQATGLEEVVAAFSSGVLASVASLLAGLASFALIVVLAGLLTFYFLRDGDGMWRHFLERFGDNRRPGLELAGGRAVTVLGGYMIGTAVISIFGAVTTAILMVILGLPLALPIAVLSFFLGFIPYIGGFIATFLAFLVTVAVGSTTDIVVMAIFTIVFNIAQGNFVAPLVYGRAVSLHPAVILIAIPAGGELAGVIGMFLVVPFAGVVAATWRTILRVIDDKPPPTGDAASVPLLPGDASGGDAPVPEGAPRTAGGTRTRRRAGARSNAEVAAPSARARAG